MVALPPSPTSARAARQVVTEVLLGLRRPDLVDDVVAVVSELVANAVIHARTDIELSVQSAGAGVRVEVTDGSHIIPRWTPAAMTAISGRGLIMVQRLASAWGVDPHEGGKTVWALIDHPADVVEASSFEDLLALWADDEPEPTSPPLASMVQVVLTVQVAQMLDSRAHSEDLARELQLLVLSEQPIRPAPPVLALARRLAAASEAFHEGRRQMLHQTLSAAQRGQRSVTLHLHLRSDGGEAARQWLAALEEADTLTRQGALLMPPFPPALMEFRRNYIATIINRLQEP